MTRPGKDYVPHSGLPPTAPQVQVIEARHIFLRTWASYAVIFGFIASLIFVVYTFRPQPSKYDPLTFPLRESVTNNVPGHNLSAIHLGQPVILLAIECSKEVKQIPVKIMLAFRQIEPPGPEVDFKEPQTGSTTFNAFLPGGCTDRPTPIPTDIITTATKLLLDQGWKAVTWQVSGTVTPLHAHSVSKIFQSDNFVIVP